MADVLQGQNPTQSNGTLPPLHNPDGSILGGIIKVPGGWKSPTDTPVKLPNTGGFIPPSSGGASGPGDCDYYCKNCGLWSVGNCIECTRCYIANGLKLIGVDILLVLLLLLAIYILFQKQINVTVTKATKAGVEASAL